MVERRNHVIIAGFGVGGRFIAECLGRHDIPFVVVEANRRTIETQRELGLDVIHGDIADPSVLRDAGVERAQVLALAISNDEAALRATEVAHGLNPGIHIIVGTQYTSSGLQALQKGADEVIVAEQLVGREFHRRIEAFIAGRRAAEAGGA